MTVTVAPLYTYWKDDFAFYLFIDVYVVFLFGYISLLSNGLEIYICYLNEILFVLNNYTIDRIENKYKQIENNAL